MKKPLLITAVVLFIALLGLIWGYLLLFGTPQNTDEIFANFGFGQVEETVVVPEQPTQIATEDAETDAILQSLRQITTGPVAGFRPLTSATSTGAAVLYAEAGVGHIYRYQVDTGNRTRISNTTIAQAREAYFTNNGSYAVIISNNGTGDRITIIDLTGSEPVARSTNLAGSNYAIKNTEHLFYTRSTGGATSGVALNLSNNTERVLFTVPFTSLQVLWGDTPESAHYIYNRPAPGLMGFVYRASTGGLSRLPISGFDLSAVRSDSGIAYSLTTNLRSTSEREGYFYNFSTGETTELAITPLHEKCVATGQIWCAHDLNQNIPLVDWYIGVASHTDSLYEISTRSGAARFLVDINRTSGRMVDVASLDIDADRSVLYFTNKQDRNLWLYIKR